MIVDYTPPATVERFMLDPSFVRIIAGPFGCVAPETLIVTEQGLLPICRIDRPMRVLSWNAETCQFQLSWCGGAFPKGTDYLYQVATPEGEFAASGHHHVYGEGRTYRPVETLRPGERCLGYSGDLPLTTLVSDLRGLPPSDPGYTQTTVGSLERYAASARQYGRRLLLEAGIDLAFLPSPDDARTSASLDAAHAGGHTGGLSAQSPEHSHQGRYAAPSEIDGFSHPAGRLCPAAGDRASALSGEHAAQTDRALHRSPQPSAHRRLTQLPAGHCGSSHSSSISERPIVSVTRTAVKRSYWDMQVLDTNNYVTADGAIHHNSGKSVGCIMTLMLAATEQAANADGVRKTRFALVRTTARKLLDTTWNTFKDWLPPGVAGEWKATAKTYSMKYGLPDGTRVDAEFIFRALDDASDVANLASLELTGAWLNEAKEAHPEIVQTMKGRVGRFPRKADGGCTRPFIIMDTNPPTASDMDWLYMMMEIERPKDTAVFLQPSGLSPEAENLENLPGGRAYYERMCEGADEEFVRVNVEGRYGTALGGKTVYGKSFSHDIHVAKDLLKPTVWTPRSESPPIIIGMDFGLTPAAAILQPQVSGCILMLDELVSERSGLKQFLRTQLKPLLATRYAGLPVIVIGDPAGQAASGNDEKTSYDILAEEGFTAMPASTNAPVARIGAVEQALCTLIEGRAGFQISPHCSVAIKGFAFGYRYKEDNALGEAYHVAPVKNMHSHLQDAIQYGVLHIDEAGVAWDEDDEESGVVERNRVTGY